MTYSFNLLN